MEFLVINSKLHFLPTNTGHHCFLQLQPSRTNLEKLGIRIELAYDNFNQQPLSCFDHVSHLDKLRVLIKCVVVNPRIMSDIVDPTFPLSIFMSNLAKLSFSGLGNSWEEMSSISSLSFLTMLKLRCYTFRGPKWEVHEERFPWLENLLMEDADLAQWSVGVGSFPKLKSLTIKHCYKLREIPVEFAKSPHKIKLVECYPHVLTCANKIKQDGDLFDFNDRYSSCDDGNIKSSGRTWFSKRLAISNTPRVCLCLSKLSQLETAENRKLSL